MNLKNEPSTPSPRDHLCEFVCIADRCKHTCCAGWEIDIDDETLELYNNLPGEFGDKIRASIEDNHFVLTEEERCPFLNKQNLCDIILKLGEDYLCDICNEHPRFYIKNEFGEYECGYGLSCEEAARLTLFSSERKCDEDDSEGHKCENAENRDYREIIDSIKAVAVEKILELCKLLAGLESIEAYWKDSVHKMMLCQPSKTGFDGFCYTMLREDLPEFYYPALFHFYEYLMFRYKNKKYSLMMSSTVLYISSMKLHEKGDFTKEDMIEIVRCYSADIEYSDENVGIILNYLDN